MRVSPSYREDFAIGIRTERAKCLGTPGQAGQPRKIRGWGALRLEAVGGVAGARAAGGARARRQALASRVPFACPGRTLLQGSLPLITTHAEEEGSFQEAEAAP